MAETIEHWLVHEANLKLNVLSFEKEFSNGYYFGQIFFNFGMLPSFLDYFQNKPQSIYRETHFDLLGPCFEQLGVKFDNNLRQSIRKEELGAAKKLIYKMRVELAKVKDKQDLKNKAGMNEAHWSVHTKAKRMGMNQKTEKIERELIKFEEEFLKQKENARLQKDLDEKRYKEAVKKFRDERTSNLKLNHDYMKEWEKNLTSLWKNSKVEIFELKDVRVRFNNLMTQKIRDEEDRRTKVYHDEFFDGIQHFEDNANRLGVELYHDPDRTDNIEKAPFNLQAMMQKVKMKSELNEASRKQKEARERYLKIKQAKLSEELAKQTEEQKKIERHIQKSLIHCRQAAAKITEDDLDEFLRHQREQLSAERQAAQAAKMEEIVRNLKTMSDEEYAKKCREVRLHKQVVMLEARAEKYNNQREVCGSIMEALFDMSDALYQKLEADEKQSKKSKTQIPLDFFKDLLKRFVEQRPMVDEAPEEAELKSTILNYTRMQGTQNFASEDHSVHSYLNSDGAFVPPLTYNIFIDKKRAQTITGNPLHTQLLVEYVDMIHPPAPKRSLPTEFPNFAPIRLAIVGDQLVGKKTLAKRLSLLLGIPVLDPLKIAEKAKSLVKTEEPENPEGAPETKKKPLPVALKGGKKQTEAAPAQLSEADLELQRVGIKIRSLEAVGEPITDEIKLELILIELKYAIPEKTYLEAKKAFHDAKLKTEEKKAQRIAKENEAKTAGDKKFERGKPSVKSLTKDSVHTNSQSLQSVQDEPFEEKYPYLRGYILLNFPSTLEQAEYI